MDQQLKTFLNRPAAVVAPELIGCVLEREINGYVIRARIVETEAYDQTDAASHSFKGVTLRTEVMFGPAGYLYVYFTYGKHYCCNIVTDQQGVGSAVLIRAVEPIEGEACMARLRGRSGNDVSNGPAKLCQALAIDRTFNGHDMHLHPLRLLVMDDRTKYTVIRSQRIGISKAKDSLLRFYAKDNPYVSRP